jgi:hypothetical protein
MLPFASSSVATNKVLKLRYEYLIFSRYFLFLQGSTMLVIAGFSYEILDLWLGSSYANRGAFLMALIAAATFLDAVSVLPSLLTEALGKPHITGFAALARVIFGLGALSIGLEVNGLHGGVLAAFSVALLFPAWFTTYSHLRVLPIGLRAFLIESALPVASLLALHIALTALVHLLSENRTQVLLGGVLIGASLAFTAYALLLRPRHKRAVTRKMKLLLHRTR